MHVSGYILPAVAIAIVYGVKNEHEEKRKNKIVIFWCNFLKVSDTFFDYYCT